MTEEERKRLYGPDLLAGFNKSIGLPENFHLLPPAQQQDIVNPPGARVGPGLLAARPAPAPRPAPVQIKTALDLNNWLAGTKGQTGPSPDALNLLKLLSSLSQPQQAGQEEAGAEVIPQAVGASANPTVRKPTGVADTSNQGIFSSVRDTYLGPKASGGKLHLPEGEEKSFFAGLTALATPPGSNQAQTVKEFINKYEVPDSALAPSRLTISPPKSATDVLKNQITVDAQGNVKFNVATPITEALFPGSSDLGNPELGANAGLSKQSQEATQKAVEELQNRMGQYVRRQVLGGSKKNLPQLQNEAAQKSDAPPELRAAYNQAAMANEAKAAPRKPSAGQVAGHIATHPWELGTGLARALVEGFSGGYKEAGERSQQFKDAGQGLRGAIVGLVPAKAGYGVLSALMPDVKKVVYQGRPGQPKPSAGNYALAALELPFVTGALGAGVGKTIKAAQLSATGAKGAAKTAETVAAGEVKRPNLSQLVKVGQREAKRSATVARDTRAAKSTPEVSAGGKETFGSSLLPIETRATRHSKEGAQLAARERVRQQLEQTLEGHINDRLGAIKQKLTPEAQAVFGDIVEGKINPGKFKGATAARREFQDLMDEVFRGLQTSGSKVRYRKNFWHHAVPQSALKGDKLEKTIQKIVDSGVVSKGGGGAKLSAKQQRVEALRLIREQAGLGEGRGIPVGRKHGLEMARDKNIPEYRKDFDAAFGFANQAAKVMANRGVWGKTGKSFDTLITKAGKEGKDATGLRDLGEKLTDSVIYGRKSQEISGKIRQLMTVTRLQSAFIPNATQSLNTGAIVGHGRTAKSAKNYFNAVKTKNDDYHFIQRTGVTSHEAITRAKENWGFPVNDLLVPLFGKTERMNRGIAALAGRDFARAQAKRAAQGDARAIAHLKKMGLDGEVIARRGRLLDAEETAAAQNIVKRSQFYSNPADIPGFASSPIGRVVTQFKTFPYQQSRFLANEALKPAGQFFRTLGKEGSLAPAARYLAAGQPLGYGVRLARRDLIYGYPKGQDKEQYRPKPTEFLKNFGQTGGAGLIGDALTNVLPQKGQPIDRAMVGWAGLLGGPFIGAGADLASGVSHGLGEDNWRYLERFGLRSVPAVGQMLPNRLLPELTNKNKLVSEMNDRYNQLAKAGIVGTGEINLSPEEKQLISKHIDKNGKIKDDTLDKLPENDRKALQKYQGLLAGADVLSDSLQLSQKAASGENLSFEQFTKQRSANDSITDAQLGGKENFASFLKGSQDQQNAYFKFLIQTKGEDYANKFIQDLQEYINQAAGAGRTNLDTGAEVLRARDTGTRTSISRGYSEQDLDFAGLSDANQRRLIAAGLGNNGQALRADAYQQGLINADLMSPFTKANSTYTPGQAFYTGKGFNRKGMSPADILAGLVSPPRSGSSGGGGRKSSGRKKGSKGKGKKGSIKGFPKLYKAGSKKPSKKYPKSIAPFVNPKKKKPLTFAQILKQLS